MEKVTSMWDRVGIHQKNMEMIDDILLCTWHSKGFSIQYLSVSDYYGMFGHVEKACLWDFLDDTNLKK